jgi:transketolase
MTPEPAAEFGVGSDTLTDAFGEALARLGTESSRFVVLDGGPIGTTGAHHFREAHPERYFGFGSAHQTMVAAAKGLASVGFIPVVTAPAAFLLKGAAQIRLSLACAEANAKIVGTQAGLDAGERGVVFQALEDIAAFRAIPGMTVIAPADCGEAAMATRAMLERDGPVYLRLGNRSSKASVSDAGFELGKGTILRNGTDVTIVACGVEVERALDAALLLAHDNIDARVVNLATIKPIDGELLARCADVTGAFVTAEDHNISGGLGGAVAEALAQSLPCPIEFVGVRDVFGTGGSPEELAQHFGIAAEHIAEAAKRAVMRKRAQQSAERPARRRAAAG